MNTHAPASRNLDKELLENIRQFAVSGTLDYTYPTPRERIATAALQGLLAANPATTQSTSNADIYATRAVRYADALLAALNQSTEEALHARAR
jgi:hypothetical protein